MMLSADFPTYSPGSRRLYEIEDAGEHALLSAEIRRSLDAVGAAASGLIAKSRLTEQEAKRQAATWRAIAEDLERGPDNLTDRPACACGCLRELKVAANGIAWADKVQRLRREIELRRTGYPAAIDKGQLTRDQAQQQLERLEAVHDLYWRQGFAFDGTREECRANVNAIADADVAREQEQAA